MPSQPFTQEELTLIEVANQTASLLGHHGHHGHHDHHSHDHHVQFKAPQKITTSLGLYALKKLNAINPRFLTVREARLLEPVTPGPLTYYTVFGWYVATGLYGSYLWRTKGLRGFASLSVVPLLALMAGKHIQLRFVNYLREQSYYFDRKRLVSDYVEKFGEQFLLNVLNPAFRL